MRALQVRMGDEEYRLLGEKSREIGKSMSEFVRGLIAESVKDVSKQCELPTPKTEKVYEVKRPVGRFAGLSPYKATEELMGPKPEKKPDVQYSYEEEYEINQKAQAWWKVFDRIKKDGVDPEVIAKEIEDERTHEEN